MPSGNKGWTIIGGTSVSSPVIASVFARAGGAHGVEYPARTLYENAAGASAALHDVSSGSNGECTHPFNESTGASGCTSAEEAASCSARAICLARAGYDAPSGVGTPDGIAAFEPPGSGSGTVPTEEPPTPTCAGSGPTGAVAPARNPGVAPSPPPL